MNRRGTGWIPDYPDLSDYTLEKASEKLVNRVQSQGNTASIEALARKVSNALDALAEQQIDESTKNKFTNLKESLEIEILSGVEFITVDFHDVFELLDVFKEGVTDPEIISIQNHLNLIYLEWNECLGSDYSPSAKSQNSEVILRDIHGILSNQIFLPTECFTSADSYLFDNKINFDEVLCLKILGDLARITKTKNFADDVNILRVYFGYDYGEQSSPSSEASKSSVDFIFELSKYFSILCDSIQSDSRYDSWKQFFSENDRLWGTVIIEFVVIVFPALSHVLALERAGQSFRDEMYGYLSSFIDPHQEYQFSHVSSIPINQQELQKQNIKRLEEHFEDTKRQLEQVLNDINIASLQSNEFNNNDSIKKLRDDFIIRINDLKSQLEELACKLNQPKSQNLFSYLNDADIDDTNKARYLETFCATNFNPRDAIGDTSTFQALAFILQTKALQFIDLISKAYKLCPPIIPPQCFDRRLISIDTPMDISFSKLAVKLLLQDQVIPSTQYSTSSRLQAEYFEQVYNLTKPIIEVLFQMLMPLGQYSDLSSAIVQSLQKIQYLLSDKDDSGAEYGYTIGMATEEKTTFLFIDTSSLSRISLRDVVSLAIGEVQRHFEYSFGWAASPIPCFFPENCYLVKLVEIDKAREKNNYKTALKAKKPLFQVRSSQKRVGAFQLGTFQQVLLPINQIMRKEISDSQSNLNNEEKISKSLVGETLGNGTLEKPLDVFFELPDFVDLSYGFSPVEDQGSLNSCTAHAGIALIEHAQMKISGTYSNASPRFLYKVTRNLMQQEGDTGASMRDTMKAMVAFGVCPEANWPYNEKDFDQDPPAFCYAFADNYKALKYFRLDHGKISRSALLAQVKVLLASEIPCAFGFTLYDSAYEDSNFKKGHLPLPTRRDKVVGGHVVVAVGYHDRKIIKNSQGDEFEGALLIRNSWGRDWGQGGYGWMPYDYVLKGLTADWWSLLKAEWLASDNFSAGASAWSRDGGIGNSRAG